MANLLQETLEFLAENELTKDDVYWVGDYDHYCNWDDFALLADIEYDDGYGLQEINPDLVIVGKNWWLERHKYDGMEWWEFKKLPKRLNMHGEGKLKVKVK